MTGRTHDLTALTALHIAFLSFPVPDMSFATGVAGLGAVFLGGLAPDIDQPTANLWQRLPAGNIIGRIVAPILGSHRMISHSIVGIVLTGYIFKWLLTYLSTVVLVDMHIVWWCFMIGYVSHIAIDLLNREGVPLLFPLPWMFGFPPFRKLRIPTGGLVEKTLVYPSLLLLNGYLVSVHYQFYIGYIARLLP